MLEPAGAVAHRDDLLVVRRPTHVEIIAIAAQPQYRVVAANEGFDARARCGLNEWDGSNGCKARGSLDQELTTTGSHFVSLRAQG
jgi:hypothetical protein